MSLLWSMKLPSSDQLLGRPPVSTSIVSWCEQSPKKLEDVAVATRLFQDAMDGSSDHGCQPRIFLVIALRVSYTPITSLFGAAKEKLHRQTWVRLRSFSKHNSSFFFEFGIQSLRCSSECRGSSCVQELMSKQFRAVLTSKRF